MVALLREFFGSEIRTETPLLPVEDPGSAKSDLLDDKAAREVVSGRSSVFC
jgi:hypothetical protein